MKTILLTDRLNEYYTAYEKCLFLLRINKINKHSNLTKSPISRIIERRRTFMNNMKFSNLEFIGVNLCTKV